MTNSKKGWIEYHLNDLFMINPNKEILPDNTDVSFVAMKDISDDGYIISAESKNFADVKNGYTYFKNNDVILAKITPCFENGKMAVVSDLINNYGAGSTEFFVFRKLPNALVLPKILYYSFKTSKFRENAISHMSGAAGQKRVPKKFLEHYPLYIPPTIEEQQEILDVLDAASEIIHLRTACIESAQSLIPALFQEMFGDMIDKNENLVSIGSLIEETSQVNPQKLFTDEFLYIDISSINNETGIIESPKVIKIDNIPSRARKLVKVDDILVAMTRPYLKGFAMVPENLNNNIASTGFSILRAQKEKIIPKYLYAYIRTDYYVNQLIPKMRGANYPAVTDSNVKSVKIPLPDIELQKQFAAKVQEIEVYIKSQQTELENAKTMFQSLLHHSFTGELTRRAYGE